MPTPAQDRPQLPGAWAWIALVGVALGLTGAVGPLERAGLHLGLIGVLLASEGATLDRTFTRRWWTATLALAVPGLIGLVPLPHAVVGLLAPGVAEARPVGWITLSLSAAATCEALLRLMLVSGAGLLAAAHLRRATPAQVERAWVWAGLGFAAFGAAHALSGTKLLLGLFAVRPAEDLFLAPLINPNHAGLVVWMAVPFWAEVLVDPAADRRLRALCAVGVAWALWLPVYTTSMGLVLVVAAQVIGALWSRSAPRWQAVLGTGAIGIGAFGAAWTVLEQQPAWWRLSGEPRLRQWADTAAILADQPLTGLGFGAYGVGYPPYRSVPAFAVFDHAHSDPVEWIAETGALGLLCVGLAVALGPRPWAPRRPWTLALLGVGAHALVDFPLQIPAIAMLAAMLLAGWLVVGAPESADDGPVVRRPWVAALAQLAAAAVLVGFARIDDRVREVKAAPTADRAAWLERWAPWRPEGWVAEVVTTADPAARVSRAAEVADRVAWDADALRTIGALLVRDRALAEAAPWLARARARDPNDWRTGYFEGLRLHLSGDDPAAAEALAEAMHHWPADQAERLDLVAEGYAWWPIGVWWVDRLGDAPAHASARLAWLLLRDGDAETALLAADQASTLRPEAHAFSAARVEALLRLGRPEDAAAHVEAWMNAHPDDPWAWVAASSLADRADRPRWRSGVVVAGLLALDQPGVRKRVVAAAAKDPLAQRLLAIADGKQPARACEAEVLALGEELGVGGLVEYRSWRCDRSSGEPRIPGLR